MEHLKIIIAFTHTFLSSTHIGISLTGEGYNNAMFDPSPRHQSSTVSQALDASEV